MKNIGKVVAGLFAGCVWFVLLSFVEGARADALMRGESAAIIPLALLALAGSALFLGALARLKRPFGSGAVSGLVLCAVVGIALNDSAMSFSNPIALAYPSVFSRGASSIAVWVTVIAAAGFTWLPSQYASTTARSADAGRSPAPDRSAVG